MEATGHAGAGRLRRLARVARGLAALVCLVLVAGGLASAWQLGPLTRGAGEQEQEESAPADEAPARTAAADEDPLSRATPRATVAGFLAAARADDWELATRYLDFSALRRLARANGASELDAAGRRELAQQLAVVLERHVRLDLAGFSDEPAGDPRDVASAKLERVGTVERSEGPDFDLLLARVRTQDGEYWLFSESTVAAVPELYSDRGYGLVEELLPTWFFDIRFLTLELWQWIGLLVLVVLSSFLGWLITFAVFRSLRVLVRARDGALREMVLRALASPLRLALSVGLFMAGAQLLHLSPAAEDFFGVAAELLTIFAVTWFLLRCVDIAETIVERQLDRRERSSARALVPIGRRAAKVFLVAIALVSLIHNLGFSVTGILTTLGVGGLAVALAAQKPLENLFGAIAVLIDQPVRVGDFCRVGQHLGTIEDIGLRSTSLRTLDRTLVSIPNAEFSSVRLENYTRRDRIWLHTTLQFGYDTSPDQLRYLLVELRRMLYAHPRTDPDPCRVRFVAFGAHSLDVELFVYVLTTDFNEFLAVKEDIQLRVLDIVAASGAYFAYPSQTLYLGRDPGRDPERTKAAEERVRAWRERGELPLPDFPPEEIARLDDTLDFPQPGSSTPARTPSAGDGSRRR